MAIRYKPNQVQSTDAPVVLKQTASANAFGLAAAKSEAAQGQAIGQLGQGISSVANAAEVVVKYNRQKDATLVSNVFTDFQNGYNRQLDELKVNRQGANAASFYNEATELYNKQKKEYRESLTSSYQKELFDASENPYSKMVFNDASKYEIAQNTAARKQSLMSAVKLSIDNAVRYQTDPNAVSKSRAEIESDVGALSAMQGLDKNQRDLLIKSSVSDMHIAIYNSKLSESALAAKKYLVDNKKDILTDQYTKMYAQVDKLSNIEDGETRAMELHQTDKTLDEKIAKLNKIKDKETREAALREIVSLDKQKKLVMQEQARVKYNEVFYKIIDNPAGTKIPKEDFKEDTQKYSKLASLKNSLITQATTKFNQKGWAAWLKLNDMTSNELAKEELINYYGIMPENEIKYFAKRQRDNKFHKDEQSKTDHIKDLLVNEGVDKDKSEKAKRIKKAFYDKIEALPTEKRKDRNEINRIKDEIVTDFIFAEEEATTPLGRFGQFVFGRESTEKYYEGKAEGLKVKEPAEKPKKVPSSASWVSYKIDGIMIEGWKFTNKNGKEVLYKPFSDSYAYIEEESEVASK